MTFSLFADANEGFASHPDAVIKVWRYFIHSHSCHGFFYMGISRGLLLAVSVWWALAWWSSERAWSDHAKTCAVPYSSWPGRLSMTLTGEWGWRWIRPMTKISPALTPLWVAEDCHTLRACVITVTFNPIKAHRQVWLGKVGTYTSWIHRSRYIGVYAIKVFNPWDIISVFFAAWNSLL